MSMFSTRIFCDFVTLLQLIGCQMFDVVTTEKINLCQLYEFCDPLSVFSLVTNPENFVTRFVTNFVTALISFNYVFMSLLCSFSNICYSVTKNSCKIKRGGWGDGERATVMPGRKEGAGPPRFITSWPGSRLEIEYLMSVVDVHRFRDLKV